MEEFGAAPDVFVTAGKHLTEMKFYLRKYIFSHSPFFLLIQAISTSFWR
jgi:hypothetical protein